MRALGILALVLAVGGCARLNSIHRVHDTDSTSGSNSVTVVTVDAKQRHLLISPEVGQHPDVRFRICAEAAPDVFSAYASSLGVDVGLGATDRNAQVANSIAETAATLERTQTVNLLRESMYRTCERYLSGALTKPQFIIQAARDQKSMVAVLAIEQLTGVVRAKPTIISGPATSAAVIDGEEAAKLITRFSDEERAAKSNLDSAEKALVEARKSNCDTKAERPEDADKAAAWDKCKAAETLLAQRQKDLQAAKERLEKVIAVAADFVAKTNASTGVGTNTSEAVSGSKPGDAAIIAVAKAVENIVLTPGIDEPLMFCVSYLQNLKSAAPDSVITSCMKILEMRAQDDINTRKRLLSQNEKIGVRLGEFLERLFSAIERTKPVDLPKKIVGFEAAAAVSLSLKNGSCANAQSCIGALQDSKLVDFYLDDPGKFDDAISKWDSY